MLLLLLLRLILRTCPAHLLRNVSSVSQKSMSFSSAAPAPRASESASDISSAAKTRSGGHNPFGSCSTFCLDALRLNRSRGAAPKKRNHCDWSVSLQFFSFISCPSFACIIMFLPLAELKSGKHEKQMNKHSHCGSIPRPVWSGCTTFVERLHEYRYCTGTAYSTCVRTCIVVH